ncbi:hypothetical protein J2Z50_003456 [Ensifer mexicanus]|nr:hypothetical protein [Sinorhizobium mexicanum]
MSGVVPVKERFNNMASVVIYTRQFCGYCSAAKKLLETKGVNFVDMTRPLIRVCARR